MLNKAQRVGIIGGVRTPFVRSFREYSRTTNHEMLVATVNALVKKFHLEGHLLGDVALGAVMTSSIEWNITREVVLGSTLHPQTPGFNVQRACATSLETVNLIALKIAAGQITSGIAGGSDTNSDLPIMVQRALAWKLIDLNNAKSLGARLSTIFKLRFRDFAPAYPAIVEPRTGMSMGQHTEKMVQQWGISRQEQDQLAYESHIRAAQAYADGFYKDLVFEFKGVSKDPMVRADTTTEKLAKLKTVFDKTDKATMTAGNSTAFTDGAGAVLLASEDFARSQNLSIQAYLHDVQATAVDHVHGAGLLMAPTSAVAQLLQRNNMRLQDFDFYEIHEAFAGQVLCTLKAWQDEGYCKKELGLDHALGSIDRSRMNVKGGSLALGHPFGGTGARCVSTLAKLLEQKGTGTGLISICTGGGMGVAAILKR
ncbi:MAG: acetyl-CoA C-acetyltransferase [Cytophagales bacterium]|nr:acetyl-CoA C-acetyltransferase [Cytophagales bacterium]